MLIAFLPNGNNQNCQSKSLTQIRFSSFDIKPIIVVLAFTIAIALSPYPASGIILHGRYLTFHGNPDTCITITSVWSEIDTIRVIVGTDNTLSHPKIRKSFSGLHRHHIALNGLRPATWYYYLLQDNHRFNHTDIDSFKTANILSIDDPLTLLLVSDFQPNSDAAGQAQRDSIRAMIDTIRTQISQGRCPYPDLILNLGDFVTTSTAADWDTLFAILDTLHELAPLLPTIGNHDGYPKSKNDSSGYVYYFNLPPSGLGYTWSGDHQYVLDYQNVRFISISMCDPNRQRGQDKVAAGSPQYHWIDSVLATTPPEIDHIIEMHHVNLTPLPWNRPNGAPDLRIMAWQNGIYNCPQAENTTYDTLRYEYYRDVRPLLEAARAISLEGHAWFCSATTPLAASIYFGGHPVFCCAGGNGWNSNKQSFCVMYLTSEEIKVDYHKVDTWPDATAVSAGYPWPNAASNRIFSLACCPRNLLGLHCETPKLTVHCGHILDLTPAKASPRLSIPCTKTDVPRPIVLCWLPIPGAVQYYIYKSILPSQVSYILIDSTSSTQYMDSCTVTEENRCFYRVTADPDSGLAPLYNRP